MQHIPVGNAIDIMYISQNQILWWVPATSPPKLWKAFRWKCVSKGKEAKRQSWMELSPEKKMQTVFDFIYTRLCKTAHNCLATKFHWGTWISKKGTYLLSWLFQEEAWQKGSRSCMASEGFRSLLRNLCLRVTLIQCHCLSHQAIHFTRKRKLGKGNVKSISPPENAAQSFFFSFVSFRPHIHSLFPM